MSLRSFKNRACIGGLFLAACLVGACQANKVDEAYAKGYKAFSQGDYPQAIAYFNKAVEADSNRAEGYLGRGMVSWGQMKHAHALPALSRAIELNPGLTWAYYYRGASLISLHRYEEGIDDFSKVTASDALPTEDLVRAHRWRGIGLLNLERYEEALEDYTRCVALKPDEPFSYLERGRVYEVLGWRAEAVADYKRYLELNQVDNELTKEARQRLSALGDAVSE